MMNRKKYFHAPACFAPFFNALLLGFAVLLPLSAQAVDMLVSSFTDTPDPAVRGGQIVYSASITNNTTDTAHNVALVLSLDAQTAFVAVSDNACSYAAGTHQVRCNYATLAGDISGPGSAQVKTVDLTVRTLAAAGNTVAISATVSTSDADANAANDSLSQLTTIDNGADLALTLSANLNTVPASSSLIYTAALVNLGPNTAGPVSASITLSPHLTYQSASGSGWTCGASGQVVTCNRDSAAVGALPNITINTQVTGAFIGTITSTGLVSISGSATDFNNSNDASTVDVNVTNGTDLTISKTASNTVLAGGVAMSFTLAPRNLGPFAASNVTVSDTLPAGFTSINAAGTGWTCGVLGQTVTCTRASYAVGAANDITVNAIAPSVVSATPLTNTTQISSSTPDGVSSNNSGSVDVSVLPDGVDLSITKSKTPNPVAQGANMSSTMRVTNHGPRAAVSGEVRVVDTLPAGEVFVGLASGTNWTCGAQIGQTVTCTYNAALAVGAETSDLILTTSATGTGTLSNTACTNYVNGSLNDPTPGNNCASASVVSTAGGTSIDLQISKTVDLPVLAWNANTATYTITLTNAGPGDATGVIMSDPLPGYLAGSTGVTASLTGGTSAATFVCSTGATVTCSQASGVMSAGQTAVFTVAVSRPWLDSSAQAGNQWINTASVRSTAQGDTNPSNNSATAAVQVDPVADLSIINTVTPNTALAGTQATYVLTVSNSGPSTANNVSLSDVFGIPVGSMSFISATPSVGSCAAFNTGTNTLNCNLGNMASGSTATVTVVVRPDYMIAPPSPRIISNTASVSTSTQESNVGNNSAVSDLTVTAAALDLLINTTDNVDPLGFVPAGSGPVFPDNVVTYRNQITNRGPSVASGLVLTYTMRPPTGKTMTFLGDKLAATGQAYANYCNQLNAQVTGPASLSITCTFPPSGILAANNSSTNLYLDFRVDTQPNPAGDAYSSSASIVANETETVLANNTINQSTTIKMRTDLQLTKSARAFVSGADAATNTVQIRQPFYWVLTVSNAGPGDSQVTRVTDTLPAGVSLYAGGSIAPYNAAPYTGGVKWSNNNSTPANGSCSGSTTISCNLGLLESGKVAVIRIPVIANNFSASLQNCASASTSEVDPNAANNSNICSTVNMQRATLDGTVYLDANNDGLKAVGETGIAGVTLRMNGSDIYGNTVTNLTVTTDATGYFIFSNRSPGTYTVSEVQPAGYLDGKDRAGTSGGTASGASVDGSADAISNIVLTENAYSRDNWFGELQPASLSGFVFIDLNANAQRDLTGVPASDESAGITAVTVSLTGTDDLGAVNTSVSTGVNGSYSFSNLRPGTYQVQQAVMPGLTHTGMTVGSQGGNDAASAIAANTPILGANKRTISNIALGNNQAASNYNFGESGQGLSGFVYLDLNNNGVKDSGEAGLAGVTVTLSGNTASGISVCTAISPNPCSISTDASGAYNFVGIPASDASGYTLTEQAQASLPLSNYADGIDSVGTVNGAASGSMINDRLSGIIIGTGQVGSNYNFGELAASLAGKVYLDVDQSNSNNPADTPLAGISITLSGSTANGVNVCSLLASCSTTTDASGDFSFSALPASNGAGYTLTQSQPVDFVDASNAVGTGVASAGSASVVSGNSVFSGVVLNAGQAGSNYLFGEKTGSISGFAYVDTNNNGLKDGGEVGIAGVQISLTGTAASGGTACGAASCTTTTAADGSYTLSNLRNANGAGYSISETQPAAYLDGITRKGNVAGVPCAACVDSVSNLISAIAFNAANSHTQFNFGEILGSSIAGRVYVDLNLNASYDAGEELAGVNFTLSGTDDLGNPVNLTALSGADGSYSFNSLRPSNGAGYSVTQTQPAGWSDFAGNSGSQVGTVNSIQVGTAAPNQISAIVLPAGSNGVQYNFREAAASIAGSVYFDANSNGQRDVGETGIAGVSITLGGAASRNMLTDASGNFSFTGLLAGNYTLSESQPSAYLDGIDAAGSAGGTLNSPKNTIQAIALGAGVAASNYLFGEKPHSTVQNASLSGKVYLDLNKNGQRDAGELLLAGVRLSLVGTDDAGKAVNLSQQTDSNGAYVFADLTPGRYTLTQSQPANYVDFAGASGSQVGRLAGGVAALNSVSQIVIPSTGGAATDYDFRETLNYASLGGSVYLDANQNAAFDSAEKGIANVTMTLEGVDVFGNAVKRSVQTDIAGNYLFVNLVQGTYKLLQSQPAGYQDGSDTAGSAGGSVNAPKNTISGINLVAGQTASQYLFGEQLSNSATGSISGKVYVDKNQNARMDAGEALAGVSVTLTGFDSNGVALPARSMLTSADGSYLFSLLPAGKYQVSETQPQMWGDFESNSGTVIGSLGGNATVEVKGKPEPRPNQISEIVLPANSQAVGYDFREKGGSLAGVVYRDDNHNGQQEGSESGIIGVTLILFDATGEVARTSTDKDGRYSFSGLATGTYRLQEVQPATYWDGKETVGQIDGGIVTDTGLGEVDNSGFDSSVAKNTIRQIQLGAGQTGSQYLFGERLASLSGVVYFDHNHNGAQDSGEAGIANVRITLSGTTLNGQDICQITQCVMLSAADGRYRFDQLPLGTYQLLESQLDLDTSKIIDGKETAGKAGGKVNNDNFGSAAAQNSISNIVLNESVLTANNGLLDGYLFGERLRSGPSLKPPIVSGYVWLDRLHTRVRPTGQAHEGVAGWSVTLSQNGKLICTTTTDAQGFYQFDNLHCDGYAESGLPTGSGFEIRFSKDGNRLPNVATSGSGVGIASGASIRNISLSAGDDVTEQNLPLDPSGVVYDSVTRQTVAGAEVRISGPAGFDPAQHLLGGLPAANQVTGSDGMYQFLLQNDFPAGTYRLSISSYPSNYVAAPSSNIPVCVGSLSVAANPTPGLVQQSNSAPSLATALHQPNACVGMQPNGAPSTQYYLSFVITPNSAPILNNHIPLDPLQPAKLSLAKTGDKQQVELGESLLYTVQIKQQAGSIMPQVTVRDRLPAGFQFIPGTAKLNGQALADPQGGNGPLLAFNLGELSLNSTASLTYRVRVGVGAMQGDGINRAQAFACNTLAGCVQRDGQAVPSSSPSNEGQFKVKVTAGVFTDQACVAGKVFVDCNHNHVQDAEELGIPGVRLYLQNGMHFTTDIEGKFSYCGLTPNSHVIKVDSQTLPRASRLGTTSNRNLGDANSLWLDVKNGELIRADFAEASCSNQVLEQVKARRSQGGVRSVESESSVLPGLKFKSKDAAAVRQATDSANQVLVKPRAATTEVGHAQ